MTYPKKLYVQVRNEGCKDVPGSGSEEFFEGQRQPEHLFDSPVFGKREQVAVYELKEVIQLTPKLVD